jgi:polyadenylate-binding protein 2
MLLVTLQARKDKLKQLEEEDGKFNAMQDQIQQQMSSVASAAAGGADAAAEAAAADERSVYVGQVDYEATPEELQTHFNSCGMINRVTILCDKFTGQSKGYAYIEFQAKEGAELAVSMNDSIFKGRNLKVHAKRQNVPGIGAAAIRGGRGGHRGGGFPRGRGRGRGRGPPSYAPRGRGRGRGAYRGGYHGYAPY